jgi:hypothetical protein
MLGNRSRHTPNRTRSGDEDIFSQERKGQRGVSGVSKGIKNGRNVIANLRRELPDIRRRQRQELSKGTREINAHTFGVLAEMPTAREAVPATPANNMPFPRDPVADF